MKLDSLRRHGLGTALLGACLLLASTAPSEASKPHFTGFPGPKVAIKAKPGGKAWVALPISMSWDSLKLTQLDYLRTAKDEGVVKCVLDEVFVPSAFVVPATRAKGLKAGSPVLVSTYITSAYGRVRSVSGNRVKTEFFWAGKPTTGEVALNEVLPLSGSLGFGQPVAWLDNGSWKHGQLVQSDSSKSWVLGFIGKPTRVATSDVRPVKPTLHKVGESVWAEWVGQWKPASIKAVIQGGLGYKIVFDGETKTQDKSWAEVMAPIE